MHRTTITQLGDGQSTRHAVRGSSGSPEGGVWCAAECAVLCAVRLRTLGRPRPRQHWGFACLLSLTTRPPRRKEMGVVRVVGLSSACGSVQAGAGPARQGSVRREALHNKQWLVVKERKNSNDERTRGGGLQTVSQTGVKDMCGLGEVASWVVG